MTAHGKNSGTRTNKRRQERESMSLDDRGGNMTSLKYMFVFVFLKAMHPSEEVCLDFFELDQWMSLNLKADFDFVITEDPKDQMICTLQSACHQGKMGACILLEECYGAQDSLFYQTLPECEGRPSVKVHFYHIICLMSRTFDSSSRACDYTHVCNALPETHCSVSNLSKTTLPEMTTTTTTEAAPTKTMISKSDPKAPPLRPDKTSPDPEVSSPSTTTLPEMSTLPEMTTLAEMTTLPEMTTTSTTKAAPTTADPKASCHSLFALIRRILALVRRMLTIIERLPAMIQRLLMWIAILVIAVILSVVFHFVVQVVVCCKTYINTVQCI
ncbi:uncharacterized protein LOC119219873 isoform X2 [Pungitius pungitius]|nr:uncharacterized protein LOC119219873 isoform X2 [Pungitius pungitius]